MKHYNPEREWPNLPISQKNSMVCAIDKNELTYYIDNNGDHYYEFDGELVNREYYADDLWEACRSRELREYPGKQLLLWTKREEEELLWLN